jgi:hypothetical protein
MPLQQMKRLYKVLFLWRIAPTQPILDNEYVAPDDFQIIRCSSLPPSTPPSAGQETPDNYRCGADNRAGFANWGDALRSALMGIVGVFAGVWAHPSVWAPFVLVGTIHRYRFEGRAVHPSIAADLGNRHDFRSRALCG